MAAARTCSVGAADGSRPFRHSIHKLLVRPGTAQRSPIPVRYPCTSTLDVREKLRPASAWQNGTGEPAAERMDRGYEPPIGLPEPSPESGMPLDGKVGTERHDGEGTSDIIAPQTEASSIVPPVSAPAVDQTSPGTPAAPALPLPPPVILSLLFGVAAEFALAGSLLYSPLATVVAGAFAHKLTHKSSEEEKPRESAEASRCSSYLSGLIATEPETPAWMEVFLANFWPTVIEKMVSSTVVKTLQEILDEKVPPYVSLQCNRFYLGKTPPKATGIQVLYREFDGGMELMEVDALIDSQDLSIIISGKVPVFGRLVIDMNDFDVEGRVQLWTLPDERLVLVNFKGKPKLLLGMKIKMFGQRFDAYRILCSPIEAILYDSLAELMQDRRRVLVPLEVEEPTGNDAVDGQLLIRVIECNKLPVIGEKPYYQVGIRNASLNVVRMSRIKHAKRGHPKWKEQFFKLNTGDKSGIFCITCHEITSKQTIGIAVFCAAALPDGSTAFWAADKNDRPIAKRYYTGTEPWKVTIPLEDIKTGDVLPHATITLELSAIKWLYKQTQPPIMTDFATPGPRSIILRVLEAHNIGDGTVMTRFTQVKYNGETKNTQSVQGLGEHPVWNQTFVFDEDPSIQTRQIRLRVLSNLLPGFSTDLGSTFLNLNSLYEGKPMDQWMELGGTVRGRLHVVAEIVPGRSDSDEVLERAAEDYVPDNPYLKLSIESASDLPSADMDGKSDPYVIVRHGNASTQTPVVPKNLNPTFSHRAILPLCAEGTPLRISCWDYDFMQSDDLLGTASVDVSEIVKENNKEYNVTVPLTRNNGKMKGEIVIKLTRVGDYSEVDSTSSTDFEDDDFDEEVDLFLDSVVEDDGTLAEPPLDPRAESSDWRNIGIPGHKD